MQRFRHIILFVILLTLLATNTSAKHNQNQSAYDSTTNLILILHSYHPGLASTDSVMAGLQETLTLAPAPPNFHVEYLDTKRHPDSEYFTHVLDAILHYKLQERSFDLVIVSGNEALNFALEHRNDLFIDTPIIFSATESFPKKQLKGIKKITGVVQDPDYRGLIEQAISLHPKARRAVIVGRTNGFSDKLIDQRLHALTKEFARLDFEFWNNLGHMELINRLEGLSSDDLVFVSGLFTDKNGNLPCFLSQQTAPGSIVAPIYSPLEIYLGNGTIGGPMIDSKQQGRLAGKLALQVLSGDDPDEIPVIRPHQGVSRFDNLMLLQHNLSTSLLPPGSQLINQPQSVYSLSKNLLRAIVVSLLISVGIIFFLSTNYLKRLNAERLYKQLSQQFQVILTGIPDSLSLISTDMKVIWSNKGGSEYINRQLGNDPGEYCCKLLYNRAALCSNCPAVDSLASGNIEEATITSPQGQVLEVKAFPIKDSQGTVTSAILLASDITEKNRLRDEAIRASRLASLGELAAGVAHEINNPNALVRLNAELVKKSFNGALPILQEHFDKHGDFALGGLEYTEVREELPHLFTEMLEGTDRIKNIVNDLKDFSRNDSPDHSDQIDLNELVQTSIRLIKNTIRNSTDHFSTDYAPQMPSLKGSFQRIEQVVVNLLINACQALSSKDKTIRVKTWADPVNLRSILQITDEGCGIEAEHLQHITEPFFTTKRKEGGTGLGLSVAIRIIDDHGGKLEFQSQPGQGTIVTLSLPASLTGEPE